MRVVALAGGTGSAKVLRALSRAGCDLAVVANVGDNVWMHGLYVCPDVDIAMYTLAGVADRRQRWGIEGDSYAALDWLGGLGEETWFRLGDRDLATCLARTRLLRGGLRLTEATGRLAGALKVRERILPASDSAVETRVLTPAGEVHLQEFWVKMRGRPRVEGIRYAGAGRARPTPEVEDVIERADRVVVCPANPVTSVGPILALRGMRGLLRSSAARKVALSPMIGKAPFSGPAGKMMKGMGLRSDSLGVARLYAGFLDAMIVDSSDARLAPDIEAAGVGCTLSDTRIGSTADGRRLAKELLEA